MPTTYDIARLAGVDQSSVSKILSGATNFRQETIDKVNNACRELGYIPNATARQLRRRKASTIAVNIPFQRESILADPFIPEFLSGVSQQTNDAGYSLILSYAGSDSLSEIVLAHRADGIIITTPRDNDPRIEELAKAKIPFVTGRVSALPAKNAACVDVNNYDTGRLAGEYLISKGHRRIAVLCQNTTPVGMDFASGVQAAMGNAKIFPNDDLFVNINISAAEAYDATGRLLGLSQPPTAIVTNIALAALGILKAAGNSNCEVLAPESPLLRQLYPQQISIRVPVADLGRLMAQTLIKMIEGHKVPRDNMLEATIG